MNLNYAIFRSEPIYTISDLAQIGSHNKREKKAYQSNPNIDLERTKDNFDIVKLDTKYVKGFYDKTKDYKEEHEKRMLTEREDRKRSHKDMLDKSKNVVADELLFTATTTFFKDMKEEDIKKWADTCMEFVYNDLGYTKEQVLHATVHMDEKTPHIHCVVIPLVKKYDKRTNTERYTISKKQYIRDKDHLSQLQDKYHERLTINGFDLERGIKHSDKEHIQIKEYKKLTSNLTKELIKQEEQLDIAMTTLAEQMKSNKTIMFDKDNVKVKKETFDSMNKVVNEAKKIQQLKPKIDRVYTELKQYTDNYTKVYKKNKSLTNEINSLRERNYYLESRVNKLEYTFNYLKNVINKMIKFVHHLVADGLIPSKKKEAFEDQFSEFINGSNWKDKNKDDFEL